MPEPPAWAIAAVRAAHVGHPTALSSISVAETTYESAWFTKLTGTFNFSGIKAMAVVVDRYNGADFMPGSSLDGVRYGIADSCTSASAAEGSWESLRFVWGGSMPEEIILRENHPLGSAAEALDLNALDDPLTSRAIKQSLELLKDSYRILEETRRTPAARY